MRTTLSTLPASGNVSGDLAAARRLAALGVPLFVAELAPDGSPRCPGWQHATADPATADAWRPGLALCAVMGHAFDVLDIDPRNGGNDSLPELLTELRGEVPAVHGRVKTPSGGWHLWIAPLGIGKHTNFLPGLDLQGAKADGTGRGLVFLPPTVRTSKVDGIARAYAWHTVPSEAAGGDRTGQALAAVITSLAAPARTLAPAGRHSTALTQASPYGRMRGVLSRLLAAQNGERNNLLYWAACRAGEMVSEGYINADTASALLAEAAAEIGLDPAEAAAAIASGMRAVSA